MRDPLARAAARVLGAAALLGVAAAARAQDAPERPSEGPRERAPVLRGAAEGEPRLGIAILSGSSEDPPAREGLAALTARWILADALARAEAASVQPEEPACGLRASVGKDLTLFSAAPGAGYVEACCVLLREAVLRPPLDPSRLEAVRGEQRSEAERARLAAPLLAREAFDDLLYRGDPYGHPAHAVEGTAEALSRDDAAGFHRGHYRSGNVVLTLSGPGAAACEERLQEGVELLPAGTPERRPRTPTYLPRRRALIVEAPSAPEPEILVGHPVSVTRAHADYLPLRLAAAALTIPGDVEASIDGPLFVGEGIEDDPAAALRRDLAFAVRVRASAAGGAAALKRALAGIEELARSGVAGERLAEAKEAAAAACAPGAGAGALREAGALAEILQRAPGFSARCPGSVEAATADRVAAAAGAHLRPDRLGIVAVVQDAGAFREALLAAGLGLLPEDVEAARAADFFR